MNLNYNIIEESTTAKTIIINIHQYELIKMDIEVIGDRLLCPPRVSTTSCARLVTYEPF
jgi:hypothetical protein